MKYVKLCDVCEFINGDRGKNYPSSKDFVDKGIPFINAGHIQNNDISFENMNYISKEKFNKLGSGKVKKNDILYCLRGSLGKNAIVNIEEGAIASSLVILRSKTEDIDVNYLIKYLNSNYIKEQILKYNNGSSQANLSAASVKNFNIYLPNYEKQKEISRILDKAQQLIDKRKQQIESLDELVKSQFIEMFGDVKKNNKQWETQKGSDLFVFSSGKGKPTANLSDENEYRCYGGNGITGYSDEYLIDYDTLVVGRVGVYCGSIHRTIGKVWITDNAIYIKEFKKNLNLMYLEYLFINMNFNQYADYSGQPKITQKPLQNSLYVLPPIELQNQFADFVKQVDKLKFEMEKGLKVLEDNINSLMQKSFSGEL